MFVRIINKIKIMRTVYPPKPAKSFEAWLRFIEDQVNTAKEKRVIEDFKKSIIRARTKKII